MLTSDQKRHPFILMQTGGREKSLHADAHPLGRISSMPGWPGGPKTCGGDPEAGTLAISSSH